MPVKKLPTASKVFTAYPSAMDKIYAAVEEKKLLNTIKDDWKSVASIRGPREVRRTHFVALCRLPTLRPRRRV